jgi:maltooligosyltrehalose trehalohydrolase
VNYWNRFSTADGTNRLIQCAEFLDDPPAVLNNTFTNCTWQDWTLAAAKECAEGKAGAIEELGLRLGLEFFPVSQTIEGVTLPKTAFQYIENHDHSRFICEFGIDERDDMLLWKGQESNWYKLQPYLIGLLTAKGIPMLWEGEEFLQTYFVPDAGNGRQLVFRPVDFSNFYSSDGKALLSLVRRLIRIRSEGVQFRRGQHNFYDVDYYKNEGLLVFSRSEGSKFSLVALNFTGADQQTTIELPISGHYVEQIDGQNNLPGVIAGASTPVTIPSNYGQIWTIG